MDKDLDPGRRIEDKGVAMENVTLGAQFQPAPVGRRAPKIIGNLLFRSLFASFAFSLGAAAAPVGICLHAASPETPADKIECFEFERAEKITDATRFFLQNGQGVVITTYRARGVVLYPQQGSDPASNLANYEIKARDIPATRRFLNPWILKIRGSVVDGAKQTEEIEKMPSITLPDGSILKGCRATKVEGHFVSVTHSDGIKRIKVTDLSDATKKLFKLDSLPQTVSVDSAKSAAVGGNESAAGDKSSGPQQDKSPTFSLDIPPSKQSPQGASSFTTKLLKAAREGDVNAQISLAESYLYGKGMPQNSGESNIWFERAANQGSAMAQIILGINYVGGSIHKRDVDDNVMAYMWFSIAAASGVDEGKRCRDSIGEALTRDQLEAATKMASEWRPKKETP